MFTMRDENFSMASPRAAMSFPVTWPRDADSLSICARAKTIPAADAVVATVVLVRFLAVLLSIATLRAERKSSINAP